MVVGTEVLSHPQVVLDEMGSVPCSHLLSTEHNAHNEGFITDPSHQHTGVYPLGFKMSNIKMGAGGQLSPRQKGGQRPLFIC